MDGGTAVRAGLAISAVIASCVACSAGGSVPTSDHARPSTARSPGAAAAQFVDATLAGQHGIAERFQCRRPSQGPVYLKAPVVVGPGHRAPVTVRPTDVVRIGPARWRVSLALTGSPARGTYLTAVVERDRGRYEVCQAG